MTMLNRSVIDEVRVNRLYHSAGTDDDQALLRVRYASGQKQTLTDPSTADNDKYVRVSADANGSSASHLIVFLNIGTSSADYDQYQFSYTGVAVADPGGVAGVASGCTITATACTTLKALVDAIAAVAGFDCDILHGVTTLATNSANFIDVTAFAPQHVYWTNMLYRDLSAVYASAMRIGIPEVCDSGRMRLLRISGTLTGATSGTIKVYRDALSDGSPTELLSFAMVNTTETAYLDHDMLKAATYRGPLVIVAASSDMSAIDLAVHTVQAEY